jgi:hypothetical protein
MAGVGTTGVRFSTVLTATTLAATISGLGSEHADGVCVSAYTPTSGAGRITFAWAFAAHGDSLAGACRGAKFDSCGARARAHTEDFYLGFTLAGGGGGGGNFAACRAAVTTVAPASASATAPAAATTTATATATTLRSILPVAFWWRLQRVARAGCV